jgi:predicted transcriptional regulator
MDSRQAETEKVSKLLSLGFTQMVTAPTRCTDHSSNILDVILTNQPHNITDISVEDGLGDHKIAISNLIIEHKIHKKPVRKIHLYDKANIPALKAELLSNFNQFSDICEQSNNVNSILDNFISVVEDVTSKHIPTKLQEIQLIPHGITNMFEH